MSSFLFDEFDPISPAAWKQKIQVDLKGDDYNETLLWQTREGIVVKPFYTKEDRKEYPIQLPSGGFDSVQSFYIDHPTITNQLAKDALERGATGLYFKASKPFDYKKVLSDIDTSNTLIYFHIDFLDATFTKEVAAYCKGSAVYFHTDILGHLSKTGNWYHNLDKDHQILSEIVAAVPKSIGISLSLFENAGATMVQQIAYSLAQANEYLEHFGPSIASQIHFHCSVGSHYFFEIAKLRALRVAWDALLTVHGAPKTTPHILTTPSYRNKTLYDYNVNMLRTTSEAMSAVLGGSNAVCSLAYDAMYHKSNEFGERIARNQLLILQEESYFKEAQQSANGSYYIENITHQLATKAIELLKQLEKGGGYLSQLKKGIIQDKIAKAAQEEQEAFNTQQLELLGSNVLPNQEDRMKENLELYPFQKKNHTKTLLQPILTKRLAEDYEKLRLEKE